MKASLVAAVLLAACLAFSSKSEALSTSGPSIIDARGNNVRFKGLAWYGFNVPNYGNFLGDMSKGSDSITKDVRTNIWRIKALGFNAIRLAFTFDILTRPTGTFPQSCAVASKQAVINSVLHPGLKSKVPNSQPPNIPGGICNAGMPTSRPWDQYVWAVGQALKAGMYVSLDFHGNQYGDQSFYQPDYFISSWQQLLRDVMKLPGAHDHILIDAVNEPDGYKCDWAGCKGWGTLTNMYRRTWNALYPICPGCLLLAEGGGQAAGWANYGDGFCTDPSVIRTIRGYIASHGGGRYADASPFFKTIHWAKWQRQVVLSPHIYCPMVTGAIDHYTGNDLYKRLQWSFGDKQANGYIYKGLKRQYPVINGEFGSTLANDKEKQCMSSIVKYMNNQAAGYKHPPITSYFYWVWNAGSLDTGGILNMDWRSIAWERVDLLSRSLGLSPWYKYAPTAKG